MIATNEAVDVLRHGWQDAATTLAADVPAVAELLQARLEMAVATEHLDEGHLLDTIQDVEALTAQAGSPAGADLARRLRRTVYEYLLALDAARPLENAPASIDQPASPAGSPMVGAEEVAALGHASRGHGELAPNPDAATEPAMPAVPMFDQGEMVEEVEAGDAASPEAGEAPDDAPTTRRRFALRRRQRHPGDSAVETPQTEVVAAGRGADAGDTQAAAADEPTWQFTPEAVLGVVEADVDGESTPGADEPAAEAANQVSEPPATPTAAFVAPRAGFHIVEDAPSHRADQDEPRLEMPLFSIDETPPGPDPGVAADSGAPAAPAEAVPDTDGSAAPAAEDGVEHAATPVAPVAAEFLAWQPPVTPAADQEEPAPQPAAQAPQADAVASMGEQAAVVPAPAPAPTEDTADDGDGEMRGWGVRRHGEPHVTRRGPAVAAPPVEDDPFENNTRLSDMRRRIEERLRRKRCDEAAALLQEVAQETGGRAVAELAMNAGDRCRALGKSNAALNCYLAAARSDPVYELPLSRLADVCIDNQDTELAVSYLERIARIYRFRGEDRAALRTYRRIATIAPYREDVLTLLMNAQRTGQLD